MSLDLEFHRLAFERTLTENKAETVVEGTLTLPDGALEIGRGLILTASPHITEIEVKQNKVVFEGALDFQFLYAHYEERRVARSDAGYGDEDDERRDDEDDREVVVEETLERVAWEREAPFAYILELPGVEEDQEVQTSVKVLGTTFELRSDQMTLDVEVTLSLSGYVGEVQEARIAKVARRSEDVAIEYDAVRVKNRLGVGIGEARAAGSLDLAGRAVPDRMFELTAEPTVTEAVVEDGQVRVRGTVQYAAFYIGVEGAGPQYSEWNRGVGFEANVPVIGAVRGATALVEAQAGATRFQVFEEEGERSLEVQTPIRLSVTVEDAREVRLIADVSSDSREIAVRKETIRLYEAVGEGSVTESGHASLDLPEGYPGIERVLYGNAEAFVDDVHVLGDRVAVELHVDLELVYVGRSGRGGGLQVVRWPRAVSLDVEVPVEGAEPGLERRVSVQVDRVLFDLVNRESVDASVSVTATAALSRETETEIIVEAVEVPPIDPNPPTYTFAVVQSGDSVWKLAARYRSDAAAILAVNDWLDDVDAELPVGAKLCVPRKVPNSVA